MSRWFRCYAGLARDEKMVRVSIKAKQPIERVIWVWIALLESAAEVNDTGRYDFDAEEAAYFLRANSEDILAIIGALEQSGRILDGRVIKWGDRQFQSDSSAERQRRYRDRKKTNGDGDETSPNVTTTSPLRSGDAPETETDTDTYSSSLRSEETREPRASVAMEALEDFERFWQVWPNKTGKPVAAKAFLKVWQEADAIIAGVTRYIRDKPADRPWLNPSTFLNQRRWEDQPAPVANARAGPAGEKSGVAKLLAEAYGIDERDGTQTQGNPSDFRALPVPHGGERIEDHGDDGSIFGRLLVSDGG